MTDFTVPAYPVYCFGSTPGTGEVTTRIFAVPSVPIGTSGDFNTAYHPTDSQGQPDGELDVSGSFTSANTVSGKLNYNRNACYGGADFTATLQTAAPGPSPGSGPTSKHKKHKKHKKHGKHHKGRGNKHV
jgi:hypothetical protein